MNLPKVRDDLQDFEVPAQISVIVVARTNVERIKMDIKTLEDELAAAERYAAIQLVLGEKGWKEHDISDFVIKSNGSTYIGGFIGTEDEYHEFMKQFGEL